MATRRRILSTLSRKALIEYVRGYDLKGLTNKTKEEIVVELLEAAVPIPITVKMDAVKVIRRDDDDD